MKKIISLLAVILLVGMSAVFAQRIDVVSGSISKLANQKIVNLEYDYTNLLVGDTKESEYIQMQVAKSDKGDEWRKAWLNDRPTRYQPKFEELLNNYISDLGMVFKPGATDAAYLMILKTNMIEPGFNVGVARKSARIDVEISIVENNPGRNCVGKFSIQNVPGAAMGFYQDYDSGNRIAEAYAKCGKTFGKYITKNISK